VTDHLPELPDLPGRAFPLVVAPPGGFEDAVRRGRRRRRKQTGGSSALALVLVGALAWSIVGRDSGTSNLSPTRPGPAVHQTTAGPGEPVPSATASPTASAGTPAGSRPGTTTTAAGQGRHGVPAGTPSAGVSTQPNVHRPGGGGGNVRTYARRNAITPSQPSTACELNCLPAQNETWCTTARATPQNGGKDGYVFELAVCRSVADTTANKLTFDLAEEADFAAIDTAHNDTVWTWSAGQHVPQEQHSVTFAQGDCIVWSTLWNGDDDFGDTPPPGPYTLRATSLARQNLPAAEAGFTHD
jgi:hypothetical protein